MNNREKEPVELHKNQIKAASRMLDRAFRDDPVTKYAFEDDADAEHPYAYEFLLRLYSGSALIYTPSERVEGVAVWLRYPRAKTSFSRMMTSGAIWPALRTGMKAGKRMQVLDEFIEKKHAEIISVPHWYLALLGVDPEFQGQGYSGILVRSMLSRIDRESLPCFLETSKEKNVLIYGRFGFQVIEEYTLPETTVRFWAMLRESRIS